MNERQKVNKIIHTYVDVEKYGDYTDYKGLITALIDWKNEQLTLPDAVKPSYCYCYDVKARDEKCETLCEDCKVYN